MADHHPSRQALEQFVLGALPQEDSGDIVGHLMTDCPTCREVTGAGWAQLEEGLRAARSQPADSWTRNRSDRRPSPYRKALKQAISRAVDAARTLERNRESAAQLYEELLEHPGKRRLTIVRNSRRFQTPELCQILFEMGFDQRFDDAQLGVELTELAVAVGRELDAETHGRKETRDLVGNAWAYHGNALRIASDLRQSEKALQEAGRHFAEGTKGDLEKALLCRFKALLLRARRQFKEANTLQERAIELYLRLGETLRAAHVMADQGLGLAYAGEPEQGVPRLQQALDLFISLEEPRGIASARHNLVYCLTECGQHERALAEVAEVRRDLQTIGDHLSLVRLRWLEGRILLGLGREWQAEEALIEVREAFVEQAIGYDVALVCLDLAAVYARQMRTVEIRELAQNMVPIFQSRDVHREATAALILFHEAALAETATLALVQEVSGFLRRAQHQPELRFRPT